MDDDAKTLSWVSSVLLAHDYNVITADSGAQALELSRGSAEKIDLLLSDFQMPGMTGIDLATQLSLERPGLGVLLMSGFPNGMLVLNEGWHFLSKPFIPSQLCALISGLTSGVHTSGVHTSGSPHLP